MKAPIFRDKEVEHTVSLEAEVINMTEMSKDDIAVSNNRGLHGLTKEEENIIISDIQSLYRKALSELQKAPYILKTLGHLSECVHERGVSLSLIMNRGELNPAALREKFDSLISEAGCIIDASLVNAEENTSDSAAFFAQFGFTTAVVDYIGLPYCNLANSGEISDSNAKRSAEVIGSLLDEIQPLRDKLFALEEPLLISSVCSRVPQIKAGSGRGVLLEDLLQEARQSLFVSLHRFDPSKGYYFHTFADDWIGKAVFEELYNRSHLIRIPEWVGDALVKANRASQNDFSAAQFANKAETSDLIEAAKIAIAPVLFSTPVSAEDSIETIGDIIPDKSELIEELDAEPFLRNQRALLDEIRSNLGQRDYKILEMRNGLNGNEPQDFNSIAESIGIPAGTARQIHRRALDKALVIAAKYKDKLGIDL